MSNFSLDDPNFNPYSQLTSLSRSLLKQHEAETTLASVDELTFVAYDKLLEEGVHKRLIHKVAKEKGRQTH
jgi:hypothetical protein